MWPGAPALEDFSYRKTDQVFLPAFACFQGWQSLARPSGSDTPSQRFY
jgi:hypothetical protein